MSSTSAFRQPWNFCVGLSRVIQTTCLPKGLRELYRRRGDSAKAQEIDREIALLRDRLADKSLQDDSRRGSAEQSEKRKLTEKIEAIVKEIYETNELVEIQTTATSRLVESLHADRCDHSIGIRPGKDQWV